VSQSDNGVIDDPRRNLPSLATPRRGAGQLLEGVLNRAASGGFDPDVYYVMAGRDDTLVEQEIMHGAGSSKFVYQFKIAGTEVDGISVVGARHLAAHCGGLRHRLVSSVSKIGALHVFTTYPGPDGVGMSVNTTVVPMLGSEPDYYEVVIEMTDVTNGNAIQQRARESKVEFRRDGTSYERPHFDKIADAKAYRNAVLALVRQDVLVRWKTEMLKLGRSDTITSSVLEEKRSGVLRYAARSGIPLERAAIEALTMDQIAGLADAAREGKQPAFVAAARGLALLSPEDRTSATSEDEKTQTDPIAGLLEQFQSLATVNDILALERNAAIKAQINKLKPDDRARFTQAIEALKAGRKAPSATAPDTADEAPAIRGEANVAAG
jgi:hypothetical protein